MFSSKSTKPTPSLGSEISAYHVKYSDEESKMRLLECSDWDRSPRCCIGEIEKCCAKTARTLVTTYKSVTWANTKNGIKSRWESISNRTQTKWKLIREGAKNIKYEDLKSALKDTATDAGPILKDAARKHGTQIGRLVVQGTLMVVFKK